jgi:hypothetical protein
MDNYRAASVKIGWTFSFMGLLLLLMLGNLGLAAILAPIAAMLALVVVALGHHRRSVTHGLK